MFKINVERIAFLNSNMHVINYQIKYRLTELNKASTLCDIFIADRLCFPGDPAQSNASHGILFKVCKISNWFLALMNIQRFYCFMF